MYSFIVLDLLLQKLIGKMLAIKRNNLLQNLKKRHLLLLKKTKQDKLEAVQSLNLLHNNNNNDILREREEGKRELEEDIRYYELRIVIIFALDVSTSLYFLK
jgi:hypothetical protein